MFCPMISGVLPAYAQCVVQALDRLVHRRQHRWMLAYVEIVIQAPVVALGACPVPPRRREMAMPPRSALLIQVKAASLRVGHRLAGRPRHNI